MCEGYSWGIALAHMYEQLRTHALLTPINWAITLAKNMTLTHGLDILSDIN